VALVGTPAQMRADERLVSLYVGEARGEGAAARAAVPVADMPPA
jgi:hypothetical protein